MDDGPLWWPVDRLVTAHRDRSLSPVEIAELAEARIAEVDPTLHAFILPTPFPFAVPFNLSGHPAVVLPVGFCDGLPAAIQLVGRYGSDMELLSIAEQLESELDMRPFAALTPGRPAT